MSIVKCITRSVYAYASSIFLILWATNTNAASFACSEAISIVERLICSDSVLSNLDDKLAHEYNTARKNTRDLQSLRDSQRTWLQKRNACGSNASCIAYAYNERISQLSKTQTNSTSSNQSAQISSPITPTTSINSNNTIAALDGNWYSQQWKYGYTLKNGVGTATSTNSPNFQIGQNIIRLTATSNTTFVGQQIYTDGKFYKVNVKLMADGRLYFEGEKNAKWVMERTRDSTQTNSVNNSKESFSIDDAKALIAKGEYAKAFSLSSKLAANGDKTAQMFLGVMYGEGKGVKQDIRQSINWFERAAKQGEAYAQLRLGEIYQNGVGGIKSYNEAMRLYRLSANQGNAAAINNMGVLYESGLGVNKNINEALNLYKLAAEKGNKAGQENFQRAQAQQNEYINSLRVKEENSKPTAESQANWLIISQGNYNEWYLNLDKVTGINPKAVEFELLYSNQHAQIAAKDGYASFIKNIKVDCKVNEKNLTITTRQRNYSGVKAHGRLLDDKKLDEASNVDPDSVYAVAYNKACVRFLGDYFRSTPSVAERTNQSQIDISNKFKYIPKLNTAQIHEYIIKKTFSPQELNLVVSLYSFLYQFTNIVKAQPQGNYAYLHLPTYNNFIRYKEEIDNAQISIDNSLNNLAASIGLTGAQLRLASGIGMASETEGNYLTDTIRTLISNGRMYADQYVKKPGSLTKKIGNLHPDIELSPPYIFEYYSQWFPSYLESKSKKIVEVAENIDQSIAQQVAKKLEEEAEAEKRRQWLSTPEGQKYQAEQNRIARERERVAAEKLAKEFPYYAIISCGMNQQHMNVLACFAGRVGTELELRNGTEYGMYRAHEISGLGQDTQEGLIINLRSNFSLKVQNSSDQLILGIKIIQRSTDKVVFVKQAAKYQTISVSP